MYSWLYAYRRNTVLSEKETGKGARAGMGVVVEDEEEKEREDDNAVEEGVGERKWVGEKEEGGE
jgi:hypothetical protein